MGDEGEYWRDIKEHFRRKQNKYEKRISPLMNKLRNHPDCKSVGNQWRIGGEWDFWHTGTVRNIKTGENISVQELCKKFNIKTNG